MPISAIASVTEQDDGAELYKGADFFRDYQWLDASGDPVDLTGATGVIEFLRDAVVLFTGTITIVDAANGKFQAFVDRAQIMTSTPILTPFGALAGTRLSADRFEQLTMDITINVGGFAYPIVHGVARFYP